MILAWLQLTWQEIHAFEFTPAQAETFVSVADGKWILHPGQNATHKYPIVKISNSAGCFVHHFAFKEGQ